jgi:hypothetical protein
MIAGAILGAHSDGLSVHHTFRGGAGTGGRQEWGQYGSIPTGPVGTWTRESGGWQLPCNVAS